MAENTADNILSQILMESTRQNDLLTASMIRNEKMHRELKKDQDVDMRAGKVQNEFAKKQQGQEVQFSKKSQYFSDQIAQHTDELEEQNYLQIGALTSGRGEGVAKAASRTADSVEKLGPSLDELGKEQRRTAKESHAADKKEASRWKVRFQKEVTDAKSVDNMLGALKTDASLLLGNTAALTSLPGIQSMLTGLKFIMANILTGIAFLVHKFFPGLIPAIKAFFYNPAAVKKKAKQEWLATERLKAKQEQKKAAPIIKKSVTIDPKTNKPFETKVMPELRKVKDEDYKEPEKQGAGFVTKAFASAGFAIMMKKFFMSIKKIIMTIIWPAIMVVMTAISGAFTALAVALGVPVGVLGLIIAGIVLVVIGLFIFWDKIKTFFSETLLDWWTDLTEVKIPEMIDNMMSLFWEKWDAMTAAIGEALTKAKEKLMGWGESIGEFLSDFKTQAWLSLQEMFVSILEGIQSAINWVIRKVNNIPGVKIAEVDFAGSMRTDLDADKAAFEAERSARGQELEDGSTAVRSAAGEGGQRLPAGFGGKTAVANVNNVQQSKSYFATGTGSSDAYANAAAANA